MNAYEQRQEARRERLERIADKLQAEGNARYARARQMAAGIPFGQPILVGHHSEKRDRAYRGRIDSNFTRAFTAQKEAAEYAAKAAAVGTGGISSDDPDAVVKLREELAKCEAAQAFMVAANKIVRAFYKAGVRDAASGELWERYLLKLREIRPTITEAQGKNLLTPDFCGRIGFPGYATSNNNANVRRIKARIASLSQVVGRMDQPDETIDCVGYQVVKAFGLNRVQLKFPGKPASAVRDLLKGHGFRWSPTERAWQRMYHDGVVSWLTEGYLREHLETALAREAA